MNRRNALLVVALAVVSMFAATGCGPSYQIVRQASPNPLVHANTFFVAPVTFEGLIIARKPEAEWLATRTPEQQASWATDKANFAMRFVTRFQRRAHGEQFALVNGVAPPGSFVIAMNVSRISQGKMDVGVRILDPAGQVVDEINTEVSAGGFGLAIQINNGISFAGDQIMQYIHSRNGL